jgi:hypothetical protein
MLDFIGRWTSDVTRLTLALVLAILIMQLPAVTNDYTSALLQVSNATRHDIDQREASARAYYHFDAIADQEVIKNLKPREPSNAASLEQSLQQLDTLKAAYNRITSAPALLQPPIALADVLSYRRSYKVQIFRTALMTHEVQIALTAAAAIYGLAGLMIGSFLAHILVSCGAWATRRRRPGYF